MCTHVMVMYLSLTLFDTCLKFNCVCVCVWCKESWFLSTLTTFLPLGFKLSIAEIVFGWNNASVRPIILQSIFEDWKSCWWNLWITIHSYKKEIFRIVFKLTHICHKVSK
jgi:hypothetical protein